jgi:biopolymer transport protein ExbD
MARRNYGATDANPPLAEINMVPLIDVMLVLLVIFIVTAPLLTHVVAVDLPRASSASRPPPLHQAQLSIGVGGELSWNGEAVDRAGLAERLADLARREPDAELRIHADRSTPYEAVAQAMALAARHGLSRIGFVSQPDTRP